MVLKYVTQVATIDAVLPVLGQFQVELQGQHSRVGQAAAEQDQIVVAVAHLLDQAEHILLLKWM
jgi:hypothetical protein